MKGTSHPGSPPMVLQKDRNGEQYAFKEENIEEYIKSFICAKFPAASCGAMTISGYWHVDIFRKHFIKHMKFGAD